ncbi:MAG TPA: hypothetical protein VK348_01355, partial [Planctomycetota bacterium]|nr:hypothetical protein [Planctomycetota bacterium]
ELTVQCRAGALQVQLQDPAGVTCFADTLRGGERQCALRLPASTGVWRCRLEFADFSGDYGVRLEAHDEPGVRITATITAIEQRR